MRRTLQEGPYFTVIGTVLLKPLYKGQVGSVRGPDRVRRHSPRRVDCYPMAVLKQALIQQGSGESEGGRDGIHDVAGCGGSRSCGDREEFGALVWSRRWIPYTVLWRCRWS